MDYYLVCRFIPSFPHTSVIETTFRKRDLNPCWTDNKDLPIITMPGPASHVRQHHIVLLCLDLGLRGEEVSHEYMMNLHILIDLIQDLLGGCVIPISVGFGPEPVPFRYYE